MKWNTEAVELLSSLERYTVLKAIEEGKQIAQRVKAEAMKLAKDGEVSKTHMQTAINSVIEELELSKLQGRSKTPS